MSSPMEEEPGPLKDKPQEDEEPKKPVDKKRRRDLVGELPKEVNEKVRKIAKEKAENCVAQIKRFDAAPQDLQMKPLPKKEDEGVRMFHVQVAKERIQSKEFRKKVAQARKGARPAAQEDQDKIGFGSVASVVDKHVKSGAPMSKPFGQQKGALSQGEGRVEALN